MEIEAKFTVPDDDTFRRLSETEAIDGFALSPGQTARLHDTYLDTADADILAAGYACRRRLRGNQTIVTLKSLARSDEGIHRREELEVTVPRDAAPDQWPPTPLREKVLELTGGAVMRPLVELEQTRTVRNVAMLSRTVAELALDEVQFAAGERTLRQLEVEVELAPDGTDGDLAELVACLRDEWGLQPQARSKFERALELHYEDHNRVTLLAPEERAVCVALSGRDDLYGRRALALLALDEGLRQAEAAERARISERRVRYWLAAFREKRLGVFPIRILSTVDLVSSSQDVTPFRPVGAPESPAQAAPGPPSPPSEVPSSEALPAVRKSKARPGLEPGDAVSEAARKTFWFHFQRMLAHESGTRAGDDIEELHDMRVATRRMRAACDVFADYLDPTPMKSFTKGLRRTGRALGRVRDLDVFWEKTDHYLDQLPSSERTGLAPLRSVWELEREKARQHMIAYLDSHRYERFTEEFGGFLEKRGAGAPPPFLADGSPRPRRLRHVVPVVVHQRFAAVRAYDEWVTEPDVPMARLHRLRIAAKGLRYALEFFREVLSPDVEDLIGSVKALQDHLGDLNDARVASGLLRDFLIWGTWGHSDEDFWRTALPEQPVLAPGVATYLAFRQRELQRLMATFPDAWKTVRSRAFGASVACALASL